MLWSYMTSPLNYHDFHREVCTVAVLLARLLVVTAVRLGEVLAQKANMRVEVFCVCSILPGRTLPRIGQIVVKVVCLTKINRQFGSNMQQHAPIKKG